MGAGVAEDVDVELVGLGEQEVGLGGDEGEALDEADAQGPVGDDLGQRQRRRLHVEPPLDDLQVRRDRPQVLVRVPVRQVPQAQRLPDLARREELLELLWAWGTARDAARRHASLEPGIIREDLVKSGDGAHLGGYVEGAVWDMEVPYDEDEESHRGVLAVIVYLPERYGIGIGIGIGMSISGGCCRALESPGRLYTGFLGQGRR